MTEPLESIIKSITSDRDKNDAVTNLIMIYLRTRPRVKEGQGVDTALTKNYFVFLYTTFCITKAYLVNHGIRHSINLVNESTQMQYEQVFSELSDNKSFELLRKNIPDELTASINHFALEKSDSVPDPHFAYFFMLNSFHLMTGFKYIDLERLKKMKKTDYSFT